MEYINRIELQGEIGAIRVQEVGDLYVANFSLVTEFVHKCNIVETCWHNIVAWETSMLFDPSLLKKGDQVRVVGRLRTTKYTSASGEEKMFYEVVASSVTTVKE
jgi:single-stranded DNA-binding protein